MDGLWDKPKPRVNRPPQATWAVRACFAMARGWVGKVGITAVPSSIRSVCTPAMEIMVRASKPKPDI